MTSDTRVIYMNTFGEPPKTAVLLWSADCRCLGSTVFCTVLYYIVLYCTVFREHHVKFPHHFIKPYKGFMQPWVTEMHRRKTLRDKLRKRKEEDPKKYTDNSPSPKSTRPSVSQRSDRVKTLEEIRKTIPEHNFKRSDKYSDSQRSLKKQNSKFNKGVTYRYPSPKRKTDKRLRSRSRSGSRSRER